MEKSTVEKVKKYSKKKIINLSIIISCIAFVLAGIIVGIIFLLKTDDKPYENPYLGEFTETLNNTTQTTPEITEQEVVLPNATEIGDIVYVDNKYIVAEDTNGIESIYVRKDSEGMPTKIDSFKNGTNQVAYDKVEKIIDDFAYIKNETDEKTYAVNLVNKEVIKETTDYLEVEFKNGFLFLFSWIFAPDVNVYSDIKVIHVETNTQVLSLNDEDGIIDCYLYDDIAYFKSNNGTYIYSYEIQSNSLRLLNFISISSLTTERILIETQNNLLVEYKTETTDYSRANVYINNKYYIIEYAKVDKTTGYRNYINFGKYIGDVNNVLDGYYGLSTNGFSVFDNNGKKVTVNGNKEFVIINEDFNKVFSYDKDKFGDIVYFDGELFVTSGTTTNIMDKNGEVVEVFDRLKYRIDTENVWNGCFLIDGVEGTGITNIKGEVIASNNFKNISPIIDGYAIGYYNGHYYRLDVENRIGTLIENYATEYDAYAFMGIGFYVVNVSDKYTIYDMKNNVLYTEVVDIKVIDFKNNSIKLLIQTSEKSVFITANVINKSIARLEYFGDYEPIEIDNTLESYEELNLNISGLSSYKKEEINLLHTAKPTASESYGSPTDVYAFYSYDFSRWNLYEYLYSMDGSDYIYTFADIKTNATKWFKAEDTNNNGINDSLEQILPPMTDWSTGKVDHKKIMHSDSQEIFDIGGSTTYNSKTLTGGTYIKAVFIEQIGDIGIISWTLLEHIDIHSDSKDEGGCDDSYTITTTTIDYFYSLYYAVYFAPGISINELSIWSNGREITNMNKSADGGRLYSSDSYLDKRLAYYGVLVDDKDSSSGVIVDSNVDGSWGRPKKLNNDDYYGQGTIKLNGSVSLKNEAKLTGISFSDETDFKLMRNYKYENGFYWIEYGTSNSLYAWSDSYNGDTLNGLNDFNNEDFQRMVHYKSYTNTDYSNKDGDEPSNGGTWVQTSYENNYKKKGFGIKISFGLTPSSAQYTLNNCNEQGSSFTTYVQNDDGHKHYIGANNSVSTKLYTVTYGNLIKGNSVDNSYCEITIKAIPGYVVKNVSFTTHSGNGSKGNAKGDHNYTPTKFTNTYTFKIYLSQVDKHKTYSDLWEMIGDIFGDTGGYAYDVYIMNLCVEIVPITNSITYYKKVQDYEHYGVDEYYENSQKIYYGAALYNDIDKIKTYIAGSNTSNGNQSSFYGLRSGSISIINSSNHKSILIGNEYYYTTLKHGSTGQVYSYIENCDNDSITGDDFFSFYNSAKSNDFDKTGYLESAYILFEEMFNDKDGCNYDVYTKIKLKEFSVKLDVGSYNSSDNYYNSVWANANNDSVWSKLESGDGKDYTAIGERKYVVFNQAYGETLQHALKRWCKDEIDAGKSTLFKEEVVNGDKFPDFITPDYRTTGTMVGTYEGSTSNFTVTAETKYTTGNYTITQSWNERIFNVEFNINKEKYSLNGANVIGDLNVTTSNGNSSNKTPVNLTDVKLTADANEVNIPMIYGYVGTAQEFTSVKRFKGWYLDSDSEDNLIFSESNLISDSYNKIPIQVNGKWLDPNFDNNIVLYAHYETVDNTKFKYEVMNIGSETQKAYYEYVTINDIIINNNVNQNCSVKQNNSFEIKIKVKNNYRLSGINTKLFNCKQRTSQNASLSNTNISINYDKYMDKITISGGNSYVTVTYEPGTNEYTINVQTTIGAITNSYLYYGGNIEFSFGTKEYSGDVGITSDTNEYSAVTTVNNNAKTFATPLDNKSKYDFNYDFKKCYLSNFSVAV